MQWERSLLLTGALGAAQRDLSLVTKALRERGDLMRHQAVSHRLARMKLRLESARLVAYRAAWELDQGRDEKDWTAMAKLAVSEMLVANAEDGLRLMAGAPWRGAGPDFSGALDDAFGALFASGTSELQLETIARAVQSGGG